MKSPNHVENFMTEYPVIATPDMPVSNAIELMQKAHIRHLPVVDKGVVIGVVSERDLKQAEILSDAMVVPVSDVMSAKPYCVKIGTSLATVAREMARSKYGCTVILNHHNQVVGIFTTTDGMRILSEILDSKTGPSLHLRSIEEFLVPGKSYYV